MKVFRIFAEFLAGWVIAISGVFAMAGWGIFPPGSVLSGLSYLPPSWFAPFAIATVFACLWTSSRRVAAWTAAAFVLLVLPHADFAIRTRPTDPQAPTTGRHLSVVALNVQYYSYGIRSVATALKQTGADVALISENALDEAGRDAAEQEFAPSIFRMGRSGETAIVSRYPILEFHEVDFPTVQASLTGPNRLEHSGQEGRRSFVHAVIDVGGTAVNVVSVRFIAGRAPQGDFLSQLRWGIYLMRSQLVEGDFLKQYLSALKGPYVFGGNLNAPPSAFVVRRLRKIATDAYLAKHHFGKATFRVRMPLLRIDYLLSSSEMTPVESHRVDVEVSDHFPVYADFLISNRPTTLHPHPNPLPPAGEGMVSRLP